MRIDIDKKISVFISLLIIVVVLYLGHSYVFAAGEEGLTGVDLTVEGVFNIVNGLACWLTRVAAAVMVIFVVIAGLKFMAARGNSSAYESAKKNMQHVLVGLVVIMGVYVIIATVANAVGATDFSFIPLVC